MHVSPVADKIDSVTSAELLQSVLQSRVRIRGAGPEILIQSCLAGPSAGKIVDPDADEPHALLLNRGKKPDGRPMYRQSIVAADRGLGPGDAPHVRERDLQHHAVAVEPVPFGTLYHTHRHQQKDVLQKLVIVHIPLERELAADGLGVLGPVRNDFPAVYPAGQLNQNAPLPSQ